MSIPGGVKRGQPRPAPEKPKPIATRRFTPAPAEQRKANVRHAQREIAKQVATKPDLRQNAAARKEGLAPKPAPAKKPRFKELPPFRLYDPTTPASKRAAEGGPRAIKDTKTGDVYFQRKTATRAQTQAALDKLFSGANLSEKESGLKALKRYGLYGDQAHKDYAYEAVPRLEKRRVRLGYAPGGKPILDRAHFEQDSKGRQVFDVHQGGRTFQAVKAADGTLNPITNFDKLPGAAQKVLKGGAFAGGKTLGALGEVFHVTGTPGRKAADALGLKGGGIKGVARTGLEILGDPTTYLTLGSGTALRGGVRAAAAASRLERAGVELHSLPRMGAWLHEAQVSGDASKLARRLESVERQAARNGLTKGKTPTQKIAERAVERGKATKTALPGEEAAQAVTQRVAPAIRDLRRPGAHAGVVTPLGSKLVRGRKLPEAGIALPKAVQRAVRVPVVSKGKQAALIAAREEQARVGAVIPHIPDLHAAQAELRQLEDLGPGASEHALTAARQKIKDVQDRISRDVAAGLDHAGQQSPRLASVEEKHALKLGRDLAHRSIISSAETGRVTRAAVGKSLDDAIKPLRKEVGTGAKLDDSLARVQFHLWAREAGGSAAREALPKLTATEEKVFGGLDEVYRSLRAQGEDLGFLSRSVEDYGGARIFKGRSPLDTINELIGAGTRPTGSGFTRHRTAPSVFDLASPTRTADSLRKAFHVSDDEARRLAEQLYQRGSVRFHAEKLARELQRGQAIPVDELFPEELRAFKHYGEYMDARNEAPLFKKIDDPTNEGRALLALGDDPRWEHFAPGTLSDEQKVSQIMQDLSDTLKMHNAATKAGDKAQAEIFNHRAHNLQVELHDLEQGLGSYDHGLEFSSSAVTNHEGAKHALASIHPDIADVKDANGLPLTYLITHKPSADFTATYSPSLHTIEVNGAHAPVSSTSPEAIARIRSSLVHELAHARTMRRDGDFFSEAIHASDQKKYLTRARRETSERGGFAPAVARRYRDQAVLEKIGGEEVARHFDQINEALGRARDNGRWTPYEQSRIDQLFQLDTASAYEAQRKHYGKLLTKWVESSARHMELLATNPEAFREAVGAEAANWLTEKVLRVQLTDLKPEHLESAKLFLDEKGVLHLAGKDGKIPPNLPPDDQPIFGYGPFEDPFDFRAHDSELFPIVDPRTSGWYRMNSQSRIVTLTTRWKSIDRVIGRDVGDKDLVKRGDYWYDKRLKQEYMRPSIIGEDDLANIVGEGRLWPTHVVADVKAELARMGELQKEYKVAGQAGIDRVLSQVRWGVTAPFPAYHIRNLISDALKSQQADSGVMFHPLMNMKLTMAAFRVGKDRALRVPGIPEIKTIEDFLFFADAAGIRSGEHMADFGRIVGGSDKIDHKIASRWFHNVQRATISVGSHREDVVRFMTFVQRLRRNGGDGADAAWYMIRHHFDYNDLTGAEKRFARNTFLFYTWYRKNIPLQFVELARRPGFFAAVSHVYEDMAEGNSPINVNWSKINPILPDMTGAVPKVPGLPSYINEQMAAVPLNWNDHAVYLGFGAPWADMGLVSEDSLQTWVSMMQPLVGTALQLYSKKESLTGRDLNANEPSGAAALIDHAARLIGLSPLQRDKRGHPVLPLPLHLALGSFPVLGRAGGSFSALSPTRDQGRLSRYGHALGSTVLGVNTIVEPKVGSPRLRKQMKNAVTGLLADREEYYNSHQNLFPGTKREHRKALAKLMRKYDEGVLLPAAKAQGISTYQLRTTKGHSAGSTSSFYKSKGRKKSGSSFGTNLGGGSFGGDLGGGSLSP